MNASWNPKSPSGFKLDLLANFAGTGWAGLMQLACIPLYIKFMGIEAYGLIGFYLMLQAILQVLDLGLSPTMNREMARYSVQPERAAEARDLARTLEIGYWLIGTVLGALIVAASPGIATHWIKASAIPIRDVRQAVMLMGILAIFQWPLSFYQGGLMGLRRQVAFNVVRVMAATLASVGAVLVLWRLSPTVKYFLLWQVAVSAVQAALLAIVLGRSLPHSDRRPRLNFKLLRNISSFAAGMSGITITAMILTQLDKLILSKLFSLKIFGYYILAGMFGRALLMLISPLFNTIFPRFSVLVAIGDEEGLGHLYHRCTQLMAVLILPVAAVLALFSPEILLLWTRNPEIAREAAPIALVLTIGTALNGLMNLPYALQLAYGWTNIGLWLNIFLMVTLVPAIWILATHFGPIGGAFAWLALNCIYMAMGVPLTHRRLLRGGMRRWFTEDVGLASVGVLLVAGLGRVLITHITRPLTTVVSLSVVLIAAFIAGAFAAPQIRSRLLAELTKIRLGHV